MMRLKWVMRPAVEIATPAVRNGHRAEVMLACGHVIVWKLSRLKTYKPTRFRCVACHELLEEFLSEKCGGLVDRMENFPNRFEGIKNDKPTNKRAGRVADARGSSDMLGGMASTVQRRFLRGD